MFKILTLKTIPAVIFLTLICCPLQAQWSFPYLEIKSHNKKDLIFGEIKLQGSLKKQEQFRLQTEGSNKEAISMIANKLSKSRRADKPFEILLYIHAMWGGQDFFEKKILKTFAPQLLTDDSKIDCILPIIWHSGMSYRRNLGKAQTIGEKLGPSLGLLLVELRKNCPQGVRVHLLCHSMGHQVFRGIYRQNKEDYAFKFSTIILAAADVDADIFGNEWGGLPGRTEELIYFINKNDRALKISEKKLKRKRLGRSGSTVELRDSVQVIDVSEVSDTKGFSAKHSGHGYFFASPTIREFIIKTLSE